MTSPAPVIKVSPRSPAIEALRLAADIVRKGGLVVFPTETVYGIAADSLNNGTIKRLCRIKGSRKGKPFTVHIADLAMISRMGCSIPKGAKALMNKFWPGPLTIVLRSKKYGTVGFRMPANEIALKLIRLSRVPVVAPSANLSGKKPPVSAGDAFKYLGDSVDLVLDGGRAAIGTESTVLDMTGETPRILREGAIKASEIYGKH